MQQIQPHEIYCSLKTPEEFINIIEEYIRETNAKLCLRPWKELTYESSKDRILQLNMSRSHEASTYSNQQINDTRSKEIFLSGMINFDDKLLISAIGLLILMLQRKMVQDEPTAINPASYRVEDIAVVGFENWQM